MKIDITDSYLAMKIQKEADFQHITVEELITRISKDYFDNLDSLTKVDYSDVKVSSRPLNPLSLTEISITNSITKSEE